jgi:hypothetical protein
MSMVTGREVLALIKKAVGYQPTAIVEPQPVQTSEESRDDCSTAEAGGAPWP